MRIPHSALFYFPAFPAGSTPPRREEIAQMACARGCCRALWQEKRRQARRACRAGRLRAGRCGRDNRFSVRKERNARRREEVKQIDGLRRALLHAEKECHAQKQQRSAANTPRRENARHKPAERGEEPFFHSRYLAAPYSRNSAKMRLSHVFGTFLKSLPPIQPPTSPPKR